MSCRPCKAGWCSDGLILYPDVERTDILCECPCHGLLCSKCGRVHRFELPCATPMFTVMWMSPCGWKQSLRRVTRDHAEASIKQMHASKRLRCEIDGTKFVPNEYRIVPYNLSQEPEWSIDIGR